VTQVSKTKFLLQKRRNKMAKAKTVKKGKKLGSVKPLMKPAPVGHR
jgi:hypothetical protein